MELLATLLTLFYLAAFAVMPVTGLVCTIYIAYVWYHDPEARHDRPRSVIFGLLLLGAILVELMALAFEPVIIARIMGIAMPREVGYILSVFLLGGYLVPHVYAGFIYLRRRRAARMGEPANPKESP